MPADGRHPRNKKPHGNARQHHQQQEPEECVLHDGKRQRDCWGEEKDDVNRIGECLLVRWIARTRRIQWTAVNAYLDFSGDVGTIGITTI